MTDPVARFVVEDAEDGVRLDRFLSARLPRLAEETIRRAIGDRIELSWDERPRLDTAVQAGGEVRVLAPPGSREIRDVPIPVLARGEDWVAVDKPPHMAVHPVNRDLEYTVIRILRRQEGDPELRLVHRLDRETTGVLLVARRGSAASRLAKCFLHGRVEKEYLAIVRGVVEGEDGVIDGPIGKAVGSRIRTRQAVVEGGDPACTRWRVERRGEDRTLVRLFPVSGRRHQLRVHLESIGHPVLGDILYGRPEAHYLRLARGGGDVRGVEDGPARQLLHAARLVVRDPGAEAALDLRAPVPADFGLAQDPDVEALDLESSARNQGSAPPEDAR